MTVIDNVNRPAHYTSHPSGVEIIQLSERQNFCVGNATKYIARAGKKTDEIEDLEKAKWYLLRELNSSRDGNRDAVGWMIGQRFLSGEPVMDLVNIYFHIFEYSFKRRPRTLNPLTDAVLLLEKYIEKRIANI